jgi:long-chain-fatty-acid--CoA ligase ACSBG
MGYLNNEAATFEVMDSEGFFHTGDLGCLNESTNNQHHLDITGRQKEIIITAGGENVSPLPIEEAIKGTCPILSHVLVIGDERKYLTALLTIKCKAGEHQGSSRKELAPEVISLIQGLGLIGKTTLDEIKSDPLVLTYI